MKKIAKAGLIGAILLILAVVPAAAQQITRAAVVDLSRVLAAFPKDTAALKSFEAKKAEVQIEADKRAAEIKSLQSKKADADVFGDSDLSQALAKEIGQKTSSLREYINARQNELDLLAKALSSSASFVQKLSSTIAQVAEAEGYSLVLNLKPQDQNANIVLWNSASIDITDKVIQAISSLR
ncbi:MAG TPA: OmpH family outer membrane protein [Rectinemataceae bacterium]|nr:OmpH family outer membrane protein [Rectinemataceae bacterium]